MTLLVTFATYFGLLLIIVPGVILGCGWMLSYFYVVDAEMGVIDAMKASWAATSGQKGKLALFALVAFVASFALQLTCCGVVLAAPLIGVAWAVICLRISGRGATPTGGFAPLPIRRPATVPPGLDRRTAETRL